MNRPWLLLPPNISHWLGPLLLKLISLFKRRPRNFNRPIEKMGLKFESPFGTAGGLDKSGKDLNMWSNWGAGFLEVGTFTPRPQSPNPGKIIDRNNEMQALWNCMGFPNAGFKAAKPKIKSFKAKSKTPVFVNVGKNRDTPLDQASKDYVEGVHFFSDVADAFVINISSPNTKDLRLLHEQKNFRNFIGPILEAALSLKRRIPLLIKISPDLDNEDFKDFVKRAFDLPIDGLILTNTTQFRPLGSSFPKKGGLSGAPLKDLSISKLKIAREALGSSSNKCLISVGGVLTPEEAVERLNLGADLVQVYSGLIFYGPNLLIDSYKQVSN